ncbi:uracil-DNA glycosylase [Radiobacillus sp. PE A8.2]|uniref:uracil-DNA glycosylase n=1 Tax=Radiobacillus sp. PE A8.2 TaxID=3380349 RepID=UPI00389096A0
MVKNIINNDWDQVLQQEFVKEYYQQLRDTLNEEYQAHTIYPDMYHIYESLKRTSFAKTKVVILGQDPYHGPGQAHGLSFSVQPDVKTPPSLQNIYKELQADLGHPIPNHGNLYSWAEQGVLLLNTVLTVRRGHPASHKNLGWQQFTDQIISSLNKRDQPIVFLLWGRHAQQKAMLIDADKHKIITAAHPSPFSAHRGFFGSKPFSRTNAFLQQLGETPINWRITNKS